MDRNKWGLSPSQPGCGELWGQTAAQCWLQLLHVQLVSVGAKQVVECCDFLLLAQNLLATGKSNVVAFWSLWCLFSALSYILRSILVLCWPRLYQPFQHFSDKFSYVIFLFSRHVVVCPFCKEWWQTLKCYVFVLYYLFRHCHCLI